MVNFKQNDWVKLLLIAKLAYNNAKNDSTNQTLCELNCDYYLIVFHEKIVDLNFHSKATDELSVKLIDLIFVYKKNF